MPIMTRVLGLTMKRTHGQRSNFQVSSAVKNAMFCRAIIIQYLLIFGVLSYKLLIKELINPELVDSLHLQTAWSKTNNLDIIML